MDLSVTATSAEPVMPVASGKGRAGAQRPGVRLTVRPARQPASRLGHHSPFSLSHGEGARGGTKRRSASSLARISASTASSNSCSAGALTFGSRRAPVLLLHWSQKYGVASGLRSANCFPVLYFGALVRGLTLKRG